jgi:hypothetical protein
MSCSRWLISYSLNVRKDDPLFYEWVITAARCQSSGVVRRGQHRKRRRETDAGRDAGVSGAAARADTGFRSWLLTAPG